jgi:CheY-like chemotaxis protein
LKARRARETDRSLACVGEPVGGGRVHAYETRSRIYLADDVEDNRALLEAILTDAGYRDVRSFVDGRSLLDAVAAEEPDLILLDLRMPNIDGHEVLQTLRDAGSRIPIIVLTAETGSESRRTALRAGASDYLTRPFDVEEVLLLVDGYLG